MAIGDVWYLRRGVETVARLTVTGADFPRLRAAVEELPAFGEDRTLFAEQETALDAAGYERADAIYTRIRDTFSMNFPDGRQVAEFLLHIHGDGTAGWRWHDQPFGEMDS